MTGLWGAIYISQDGELKIHQTQRLSLGFSSYPHPTHHSTKTEIFLLNDGPYDQSRRYDPQGYFPIYSPQPRD